VSQRGSGGVRCISYLLGDYVADAWITVSQCVDCYSGGEIEVFPVLDIPKIHPLTFDKHWRWADIGFHHEGGLFGDESCGGRV